MNFVLDTPKLMMNEINACSKNLYSYLASLLPDDGFRLSVAMKYSLISNGKCLRSFFLIETAKSLGVEDKELLKLPAAVIEMIHTYSLIHDDLPAMDNDDIRRGKPSCHKKFDEATAILAGDSLLTLAFELLASEQNKIDIVQKNQIISILARAIGFQGMAGGQMYDMMFEMKEVPSSEIYLMQGMKTAELFMACGQIAAVLANSNQARLENIMKYSYALGLTFQIIDDLLDEIGDEHLIGKKTKKDTNKGKARLIDIFGIEEAKNQAKQLMNWGLHFVKNEPSYNFFKNLADFIIHREY